MPRSDPSRYAAAKPDPAGFLKKGDGELVKTRTGPYEERSSKPAPPVAGAYKRRENPPNTAFRRFYERGDLPIAVDHRGSKNMIAWKVRRRLCAPRAHESARARPVPATRAPSLHYTNSASRTRHAQLSYQCAPGVRLMAMQPASIDRHNNNNRRLQEATL